ncbi:hypothetical protein H8356DRAFT_1350215 [Neocallimastix lanati (nom. inval.)]|nr:hypothetical protein H8356DRAFT_1350215 [Neocallimastix sp. JGI-2020a]
MNGTTEIAHNRMEYVLTEDNYDEWYEDFILELQDDIIKEIKEKYTAKDKEGKDILSEEGREKFIRLNIRGTQEEFNEKNMRAEKFLDIAQKQEKKLNNKLSNREKLNYLFKKKRLNFLEIKDKKEEEISHISKEKKTIKNLGCSTTYRYEKMLSGDSISIDSFASLSDRFNGDFLGYKGIFYYTHQKSISNRATNEFPFIELNRREYIRSRTAIGMQLNILKAYSKELTETEDKGN